MECVVCLKFSVRVFADATAEKLPAVPKWAAGGAEKQSKWQTRKMHSRCLYLYVVWIKSRGARWKMRMEWKTSGCLCWMERASVFAPNRTYITCTVTRRSRAIAPYSYYHQQASEQASALSVHLTWPSAQKAAGALKNKRTARSLIQQAQSALCGAKTTITRQKAEHILYSWRTAAHLLTEFQTFQYKSVVFWEHTI